MKIKRMLLGTVAVGATGAALAVSVNTANGAGLGSYDDYSRLTQRSAGRFWSDGAKAGQWSWRTDKSGQYSVNWTEEDPGARERFVRSKGGWLLLDGWSGNGTYYRQRVTEEKLGDAHCSHMKSVSSDGHRQHYVKWNVPEGAYCLDAKGTVTETSSGKKFHFRHRQVWSPPAPCSNAYITDRSCINQHETWWDDNQHPMRRTRERDQYLAKGLGMAFKIRQTVPSMWSADMKEHGNY